MADGTGFEPVKGEPFAALPTRCLKPLGHPSINGALSATRTRGLPLRKRTLFPLSYKGLKMKLAERTRFERAGAFTPVVFKTTPLNHSGTSPGKRFFSCKKKSLAARARLLVIEVEVVSYRLIDAPSPSLNGVAENHVRDDLTSWKHHSTRSSIDANTNTMAELLTPFCL